MQLYRRKTESGPAFRSYRESLLDRPPISEMGRAGIKDHIRHDARVGAVS
jgi:hypothetical protein